ncbi:MAG: hypothetical protein F9K18_00850 [Thermoanaerobaculia bacterium]|nr:MAG: hypothetical protein F9K18_00850 [Thermoanaerobaculia bacterium]
MRSSSHIRLLALGLLCWLVFWVLGLPAYYQQYSTVTMLGVSAAVTLGIVVVGLFIVRRTRPERRLTLAVWISFYFTVPLAVADFLYCGIYLGAGLQFLAQYWYLTAFYIIPWLVMVPLAWLVHDTTRVAAP